MSVLAHPLIAQRYFFPRPKPLADAAWVETAGARLACYHLRARPGAPTLVHFHGNGEVVGDYVPWWPELLAALQPSLGLGVFMAEYRGFGGSTGEVNLLQMLDDVPAVLDAVGQPPSSLIVYGRSVGSAFALEALRQRRQIRAVILESGVADLMVRITLRLSPGELGVTESQFRQAVDERLNQQAKLADFSGKLLVMHAHDDEIVPVTNAHQLYDWAAQSDRALTVFERGGHNTLMPRNMDSYLSTLRGFLTALPAPVN